MNPTRILLVTGGLALSVFVGYQIGLKTQYSLEQESDTAASEQAKELLPVTQVSINTVREESDAIEILRLNSKKIDKIFETEAYAERLYRYRLYLEGMTPDNVSTFLAEIEALPEGRRRTSMMHGLYARWGEVDGAGAFEHVSGLSDRERSQYMSFVAKGWAQIEPMAAWEAMVDKAENGARYSFRPMIEAIAAKDITLATRLLAESDSVPSKASSFRDIVEMASNHGSFSELFSVVKEVEDSEEQATMMESLFRSWSKGSFDESLTALSSLTEKVVSDGAIKGMLEGWAAVDGKEAFNYALENSNDPSIAGILPKVASAWANSASPEELVEIAAKVSTLETSGRILSNVLKPLAKSDPRLAMEYALNSAEDPESSMKSVISVMNSWARSDLPEARSFLSEVADDGQRASAAGALVYPYIQSKSEPSEIVSMIDQLESPENREQLLLQITQMSTFSIGNSKKNSEALRNYLETYIPTRTDMSEEAKAKMMKQLASAKAK